MQRLTTDRDFLPTMSRQHVPLLQSARSGFRSQFYRSPLESAVHSIGIGITSRRRACPSPTRRCRCRMRRRAVGKDRFAVGQRDDSGRVSSPSRGSPQATARRGETSVRAPSALERSACSHSS
ncbi:unnamed protein product [Pleuronectes platessa]|uniref:Uncharacterized protein n=1 Tax=Pleuronectes platessa TaxID=8262 RepID=A0A9N7YQZ4_PLEPL|nr:unnamed protein product [Pleuronectes platessa]